MNTDVSENNNHISHTYPPLTPGTLYLVSTPIGNMEDITLRAIRTLRECTLVAAEDTRHTGLLLNRLGFKKQLLSYHTFNEVQRQEEFISRLRNGEIIALVTDAGTPAISDPGQRITAAILAAGFKVESVPGPCALIAALAASGLPTDEFHFIGFLPHKSGQRKNALTRALPIPGVLVLYESPYRIDKLLNELQELAPLRTIILAREITKKFEEWLRGTPQELLKKIKNRSLKGEFVILIAPEDFNTTNK